MFLLQSSLNYTSVVLFGFVIERVRPKKLHSHVLRGKSEASGTETLFVVIKT